MMAPARREVAALNDAARSALRNAGRLGPEALMVGESGIALGDKVVCLRNDRHLGVVNGTVGTVERCQLGGLVITTRDGPRHLPARYLEEGHLAHGYALTVHKAQGLTVETAYVLATENLSREAGYVAMSRARAGTELFVPLGAAEDSPRHDPRQPAADPMALTARRLATSRAKQLASSELAPIAAALADAAGGMVERSVYRDQAQIGGGHGTSSDDPDSAGAEVLGRHRTLHDAMNLAIETRERVESELARSSWGREPTQLDRSRGRGR